MDLTTAQSMLIDAQALVERLESIIKEEQRANLPTEPLYVGGQYTVITFTKFFGRTTGRAYTYAAIRPRAGQWFITGRQPADPVTGMSWAELVRFMAKDEFGIAHKVYQSITQWKKA